MLYVDPTAPLARNVFEESQIQAIFVNSSSRSETYPIFKIPPQLKKNFFLIAIFFLIVVIGPAIHAELGVGNKILSSIFGLIGGIGAGTLLFLEARKTERRLLLKMCFYVAGSILLFETVMLLDAIILTVVR
jgi:hypothetical protein